MDCLTAKDIRAMRDKMAESSVDGDLVAFVEKDSYLASVPEKEAIRLFRLYGESVCRVVVMKPIPQCSQKLRYFENGRR